MKRKSFITFLFLTLFSFVFLFSSAPVSAEDNHYLDDEHYFISKEKLSGGWINVALATMKTPA